MEKRLLIFIREMALKLISLFQNLPKNFPWLSQQSMKVVSLAIQTQSEAQIPWMTLRWSSSMPPQILVKMLLRASVTPKTGSTPCKLSRKHLYYSHLLEQMRKNCLTLKSTLSRADPKRQKLILDTTNMTTQILSVIKRT